jgi:hypothetical protein
MARAPETTFTLLFMANRHILELITLGAGAGTD